MIPQNKLNELKALRCKIQACRDCDLRQHYDKPVACAGSPIAEVMFIGEAPGAEETEQGKPFVGASGQMLRTAILDAGLDLENVFITNVLCCRPLGNTFPSDVSYIKACRHWLYEQMLFIRPKIIVSVGGQAHKHIRESDIGITKACGKWEEHVFSLYSGHKPNTEMSYRAWYMATLHPSFCMRGPDTRYANPVMELDRQGKENLLKKHIASIPQQLQIIKGGQI